MDVNRFYRCQKNLIVNLEKIMAVDAALRKVTFENGLTVDIAAKQISKLAHRVQEYKAKLTKNAP